MFSTAALSAKMNRGGNSSGGFPAEILNRGILGSEAVRQAMGRAQNVSVPDATGQVSSAVGMTPQVPMASSYNEAANTPVFSPEAQESAASVFGTNDQRQTAVTGPRQEAKDKIISEINNL